MVGKTQRGSILLTSIEEWGLGLQGNGGTNSYGSSGEKVGNDFLVRHMKSTRYL